MSDRRGGRPGGLGRGLDALLGERAREPVAGSAEPEGLGTLPVGSLHPHPDQPRRHFDEAQLDELAASIRTQGLIQPIVVRPHGHGYQIIAGERRWRAAQRAQLREVPVVVRAMDDRQVLEVALLENIQRADLNAIEEAQAFQRLQREFGHTQEALSGIVHKSRSHIANLLRLLDLPAPVQQQLVDGALTMGHARALIGAADAEELAKQVVARGLTVRETEDLARNAKRKQESGAGQRERGAAPDGDVAALERQLADLLGVTVRVSHGGRGGTLTLGYSTLDQLDMLCQRLSGEPI